MTQFKNQLAETLRWFRIAVPEPDFVNFNSQVGCHLEEVVEMLEALNGLDPDSKLALGNVKAHLSGLSEGLKLGTLHVSVKDPVELLDSLTDQTVTAAGVSHMCDFKHLQALEEVNRSNFSKFEDGRPVFKVGTRKIGKGKDYTPPDLTPFV